MTRGNPGLQVIIGCVLLILGLGIGGELLQDLPGEEDPTVAKPLRRSPSSPIGKGRPTPTSQLVGSLAFIALGLGITLHGARRLKHQGTLLRDGVAVVGRIVHIHHERKRASLVTYRFTDDHGHEHEGVYSTYFAGGALDELQQGQEVTVVYNPANPREHLLDVDHVRRADAALRRL